MTWTLSPALLVWMIRTFLSCCCALRHIGHRMIAARSARPRRSTRVLVMIVNLSIPRGLSHYPGSQRLPLRIVLRGEVLAAVVIEVAARRFLERMREQLALHAARRDFPPDDVEVLARFFLRPRRRAGVERLQAHRCAGRVTDDAPGVAGALVEEDGLDLRLEKLVVQRRTGRGRGRLLAEHARDQHRPAAEGDKRADLIHGPLL